MTTTSEQTSAKIYAFPARGRFAVAQRDEMKPAMNFTSHPGKVAVGDAWYHDAAIKDSQPSRKN
jgi:hypothetical protein